MNPRTSGHTIGSAHIGTPAQSGDELAQRARHRYQCAECGAVFHAQTPAALRMMALQHHGIVIDLPVVRHVADIPQAKSGTSGTD